jgi:hypothetical protein
MARMAGELLTPTQRVLWKRYDQHGTVTFMTDAELKDWAAACETLMVHAGDSPKMAKKARSLWRQRLAEATTALDERAAE